MLTARELAASLRVLRTLRTSVCATVLLTWDEDDTRAYVRLARAGYVATCEARRPVKSTAPFRWDRIAATPAGLEYLRQIDNPRGACAHPRRLWAGDGYEACTSCCAVVRVTPDGAAP